MLVRDFFALLLIAGGFASLVFSAFLVGPALGFCALGLALAIVGMIILRATSPTTPGEPPTAETEAKQ